MMQEKKTFQPLNSKNICEIYGLLNRKKYISFPLTYEAQNKVEALVSNINGKYFGQEVYTSPEDKIVAYLYFLIKNHPFTDGNKRTAVLVFEVLCDLNNLNPKYKDFALDELAVFIEKSKPIDHQLFINQIANIIFN